ncbi:hypothetical protein [Balneatrix alpica]|uniref:Uncharacterized protein n=1 Tax=Balneatrix alpica TaxID=75684 RepID=A0ABV5ZDI6_9GAMM|nr:hypothetical protein [Balneatrix alpica]
MDIITTLGSLAAVLAAVYAYKSHKLQTCEFEWNKYDRYFKSNPTFNVVGGVDKFEGDTIFYRCKLTNISEYQANINSLSFLFYFYNPSDPLACCAVPYNPNISNVIIDRTDNPLEFVFPIDLKCIFTPSRVNLILRASYIDRYGKERIIQHKFDSFSIRGYLERIRS